MSPTLKTLTSLLAVMLSAQLARSAEPTLVWPRFRGPNGSGIADNQRPPVEFGPEKNLKWKTAIPSGLSSPIATGDQIVVTGFDAGRLYTLAYNREDGS